MELTKEQERWLTALESGDYPKGEGALNHPDIGYCCLGVACDLWGLGEWEGKDECGNFLYAPHDGESGSPVYPPKSIVDLLGLRDRYGSFDKAKLNDESLTRLEKSIEKTDPDDEIETLATINDDLSWSFEEIAALIRNNPEAFFSK